jgi:ABC-2 type transport system permease protein
MLLWSTLIHAVSGSGTAGTHLLLVQMWVMLLYHLFAVHGLWYAPFYGWLLLVSAWAKRAALLWAVISVAAIAIAERILLGSQIFLSLLEGRLMGGPAGDFGPGGNVLMPPLSQLTPGRFLISPGLWVGLLLSALFLTLAVRLRRQRGPI